MKFISSGRRIVACSLLVLPLFFMATFPAHSRTTDTSPPVIELEEVTDAFRGDSQVFTVSVTDDQAVGSVVFHYRLGSDSAFINANMSQLGQSDLYTFAIQSDTISVSISVIEYYIEAMDEAGNRTLEGFSFDPLRRTLKERSTVIASDVSADVEASTTFLDSMTTTQKVVYGVLGVVVVGALISSGGGGDDAPADPLVPVTIFADPLDISQ